MPELHKDPEEGFETKPSMQSDAKGQIHDTSASLEIASSLVLTPIYMPSILPCPQELDPHAIQIATASLAP